MCASDLRSLMSIIFTHWLIWFIQSNSIFQDFFFSFLFFLFLNTCVLKFRRTPFPDSWSLDLASTWPSILSFWTDMGAVLRSPQERENKVKDLYPLLLNDLCYCLSNLEYCQIQHPFNISSCKSNLPFIEKLCLLSHSNTPSSLCAFPQFLLHLSILHPPYLIPLPKGARYPSNLLKFHDQVRLSYSLDIEIRSLRCQSAFASHINWEYKDLGV